MKKALYILTAVLLIGVVITGCGKKDNPFEPSTDSFNATQAMESKGPKVIDISTLDGDNTLFQNPAYDEIGILFDADMNAGTINTTNILLQDVESPTTAIPYTVTYNVGTKKAIIKATSWDDDLSYMVTVTTNVRDIHGHALDGNGNDFIDPQDSKKTQFWGNNSAVAWVDVTPPTITVADPTNERIYFSLTDSIEINIFDNDSVDAATLTASAFELTTASGQVVSLGAITVIDDFAPTWYIVRFHPTLTTATDYFLTVKTTIKDMKGNSLDGNGNGLAENEALDRERVKFRTYDPRNGGVPSSSNLRVINTFFDDWDGTRFRSMYIQFNRKMNAAYLNSNYIKIYNDANYEQYVPGTITIMPDTMLVRYTLENFDGAGTIWVSRQVRDTSGLMLDENNNGIPGEAAYVTSVGTYKPADDLWKNASYSSGFRTILFYDMVESGNIGWSTRGTTPQLWHRSTLFASQNPSGFGGNYLWHCGVDADTSYLYNPIAEVHDTLVMPIIDLTWYGNASLSYDRYVQIEGAVDRMRTIYSYRLADGTWSGWATWVIYGNTGWGNSGNMSFPVTGTQVKVAFAFDTDAITNTADGAFLDRIQVLAW
ncbi:Ig-like domain-containing protein [candidate division TA06 bacterium]|nr:Ig-like domain-containing protein [candidate division TA06 bacterium]